MPRAERLTSTADFRRTYAAGRRASSEAVIVHANRTGEARSPRVGISAGSKIGGAVQRNRSKRRLRAAARVLRPRLEPGVDVVLVATPETGHYGFQELVDSVTATLAKAEATNG